MIADTKRSPGISPEPTEIDFFDNSGGRITRQESSLHFTAGQVPGTVHIGGLRAP